MLTAPALPPWLDRLVPFRRFVVKAGRHAMHVMEAGAGFPVLLLHGNPTWGFLWRKVARALEGEPLRLVMPDLVGLGLSDKPRELEWHTLEHHAVEVAALIDALGLERLIFAGQDWGGPIGLAALAARPERVKGLVLLNTAVSPPHEKTRPTAFHRFSRLPLISDLVFRVGGFPMRGMATTQGDPSSISGEVARAYRWPLRRIADRAAPLAMARMVPPSVDHPSVPALRRAEAFVRGFSGPAELVWGDRDPILGRTRKRLEALLPGARVTRTGAGHFLQEEAPVEIADAIRRVARAAMGEALAALLGSHQPADAKEDADLRAMRAHARELQDPFSRRQKTAHFTGSAVVVDPSGQRVCLVHHGTLNRWLQPGGHADPADLFQLENAALREAREETGMQVRLHPSAPRPLDVDVHAIPARPSKGEPAHDHLDVRFLVVADDPAALAHDPAESHGARWLSWDEALAKADEPALRRLLEKARRAAR